MDSLLRLRSRGIAKHLTILNEQMPTPNGVNNLLLFLIVFFEIWRISRTRIKSGRSSYVLMFVAMLPYSVCFEGYTIYNVNPSFLSHGYIVQLVAEEREDP